jgi:hypothetical protein
MTSAKRGRQHQEAEVTPPIVPETESTLRTPSANQLPNDEPTGRQPHH